MPGRVAQLAALRNYLVMCFGVRTFGRYTAGWMLEEFLVVTGILEVFGGVTVDKWSSGRLFVAQV